MLSRLPHSRYSTLWWSCFSPSGYFSARCLFIRVHAFSWPFFLFLRAFCFFLGIFLCLFAFCVAAFFTALTTSLQFSLVLLFKLSFFRAFFVVVVIFSVCIICRFFDRIVLPIFCFLLLADAVCSVFLIQSLCWVLAFVSSLLLLVLASH